jgi:membrane protease subunit HflK
MPWNQGGGGGPWGSGSGGGGGGSPWGRPSGGGGGQQPPNIEDMLRRSQERMKQFMPGGFGPGKVVAAIAAVVAVLWIISGFYRIQPGEVGLVLQFGRLVAQTGPGLNWHIPAPIQGVEKVNVSANNQTEIGFQVTPTRGGAQNVQPKNDEAVMLTGDENILELQYVVQWEVSDASAYLFNVRNRPELVKAAGESAMREVIGQMPAQRALAEGRTQLAADTQRITQRILNDYNAGIRVLNVQIRAIDPPNQVIEAFRDVQRAQADRERARNEAEAYRNDVVPRARGEAQRMVLEAEAYRQQVIAEAQGEARRFNQVYEAYRLAPEVTMQRLYLETMEQVLRGSNRVIIDQSTGGSGVIPYLPLPEVRRGAPVAPAPANPPSQPGQTTQQGTRR